MRTPCHHDIDLQVDRPSAHSQMSASVPSYPPVDPSLYENRPMHLPNSASNFGMQYPRLDAYNSIAGQSASLMPPSASGWKAATPVDAAEYSGWRGSWERTLPAIADFDHHAALGMPRSWGNEPKSHHDLCLIQLAPMNDQRLNAPHRGSSGGECAHGSNQSLKRGADAPGTGPEPPAADDCTPHSSDPNTGGSGGQHQEQQVGYAAAPPGRVSRSGDPSKQKKRSFNRARTDSQRRSFRDTITVAQTSNSHSFHRPSRSKSASPASSAGSEGPRISTADEHPMGMAAVTTTQSGSGISGLRWWGEYHGR